MSPTLVATLGRPKRQTDAERTSCGSVALNRPRGWKLRFIAGAGRGLGLTRRSMDLSAKQKQYLKALAHPLKPVVQVGAKGIGEGLVEQIVEQLSAHELIKVRFNSECAVEPREVAGDLARQSQSQLVQTVGRTLVLYRRRTHKPKIDLPTKKRQPGHKA